VVGGGCCGGGVGGGEGGGWGGGGGGGGGGGRKGDLCYVHFVKVFEKGIIQTNEGVITYNTKNIY